MKSAVGAGKRRVLTILLALSVLALLASVGVPAFAQTHLATLIPGQPLSYIAAEQIILNSGLPAEKLPDGSTDSVTRGRDAVNAYRHAHTMLSANGWYRGLSEDHTPLLVATLNALSNEGFTSNEIELSKKAEVVLKKFWKDSDEANAKEVDKDKKWK